MVQGIDRSSKVGKPGYFARQDSNLRPRRVGIGGRYFFAWNSASISLRKFASRSLKKGSSPSCCARKTPFLSMNANRGIMGSLPVG